jgi:xyloglucan 6-xylosyltransferase
MCGLMTVLVLRGTIGAGQFGTPAQDFEEIRMHLQSATGGMMLGSGRVLAQVEEENKVGPAKRLLLKEDKDDKDHISSSNDPNKPYRLGPVITDWDQQRQAWKAKNPNVTTTTKGKPRMLLVTGSQPTACENPVGDHYLLMSIKNKIDYCRLHNIEIFYNMAHLDAEMAGFWAKLPLIRKLMLGHPQVEWIWWMDSDAMFTDMLFEVPLEKYEKYNLVMHGFDELVFKEKSWTGLNTGSFLIRNCQWTLDLLDAWAPMGPKGIIRDKAGKKKKKMMKKKKIMCLCLCFFVPSFFNSSSNPFKNSITQGPDAAAAAHFLYVFSAFCFMGFLWLLPPSCRCIACQGFERKTQL